MKSILIFILNVIIICINLSIFAASSGIYDRPTIEEQRRICQGIWDKIEDSAQSFKAVLLDEVARLEEQRSSLTGKMFEVVNDNAESKERRIQELTKLIETFTTLRSARIFEEHDIHVFNGDQFASTEKMTESFLSQILNLFDTYRQSSYATRTYDFEEYFSQYEPYQQAMVEINREEHIYLADCVKYMHDLLGDRLDAQIERFITTKVGREDKYLCIYFRILRAYANGRITEMPSFSLWALEYLDKNPLQAKCDQLRQAMKTASSAATRLKLVQVTKESEEFLAQANERQPILEKYYREALEILERIKDLSEVERRTLETLKQKSIVLKVSAGTVKKKKNKKKKKPSQKSDDAESAIQEEANLTSREATTSISHEVDSDEAEELEEMMVMLNEQFARDREAKKDTLLRQVQIPVLDVLPTQQQVLHRRRSLLIEEFWTASTMPWDDFEHFMTNFLGGAMEARGGSHRKFRFMRDDSEWSLPAFNPHKSGDATVRQNQLKNARAFVAGRLRLTQESMLGE